MDEKWFYSVVTRAMEKVVTYIGLEPVVHYLHQKTHVGKEMYIMVTGYEVLDNDTTKNDKEFPFTLIQDGKFIQVKKDTYKWVYKEDGT